MIQAEVERYSDPQAFARDVNLPLLGGGRLSRLPSGASLAALLAVQAPPDLALAVDRLVETRRSLTLRTLLLAGFPEDPECFALGLALAREWSRRGFKLAVIDLDFENPTIVRPLPHPNEGMVDALEFGCSFRRIAWEIVAQSLWAIGAGSYPPDPIRFAEHPDWERVARSFAAHVDVALLVAPALHRTGLVGRLSKRMDGVLLAASVERIARSDLRDAFLELWSSDAPIIGVMGIEPAPDDPIARERIPLEPYAAAEPGLERTVPQAVEATIEAIVPRLEEAIETISPRLEETIPPRDEPGAIPPVPQSERILSAGSSSDEDIDRELTSVLEREVRLGRSGLKSARVSRARIWAGAAAGLALAASLVLVVARRPPPPPAIEEAHPAGLEPVLPAPDPAATGGPASDRPAPDHPLAAGVGGAPSPLPDLGTRPGSPPAGALPESARVVAPAGVGGSARVPGSAPPAGARETRPFRVHVASFRSESKVREIVRNLRGRGQDAWYERAPDARGYYRVYVGRFATEKEAAAHARWLLETGWVERAQTYPPTVR